MRPLTDAECDAFRRLPTDFNGMVRAIFQAGYDAGRADMRAKFQAAVDQQEARLQEQDTRARELLAKIGAFRAMMVRHGIALP